MVVADATFQRISIKHSGFNPDSIIEASFEVLSAVPDIMTKVRLFEDRMYELSHKFVPQGFWNHELGPLEWKPEADAVMHRAEFWETFRSCLSKLPDRVADVFMLREMEEMKTEQIRRDLNITPNNLWVMLHRARMALRVSRNELV